MSKLFDLVGRTILITGGTKGMGQAIALAAGGVGAHVIITGQSEATVSAAVAALEKEGIRASGFAFEVSQVDQAQRLAERVLAAHSKVDGLVLGAAAPVASGQMTAQGPEVFAQAMSSVQTHLELVRALAPSMKAGKDGSIVAISSRAAKRGSATLGIYGMAKAALDEYVRSLALELGPYNVNVNSICPGPVRTAFARGLWEDPAREEALNRLIPMQRIAEPQDVAGLALLLLSPAGRYIHGQNISVDGGMTA